MSPASLLRGEFGHELVGGATLGEVAYARRGDGNGFGLRSLRALCVDVALGERRSVLALADGITCIAFCSINAFCCAARAAYP